MKLERVLVCERGPMAGYIVQALRRMGIEAVAPFRHDEECASYLVDVAFGVPMPQSSGTIQEQMVALAMAAGCAGVHPGAGPLAEDASFANAVEMVGMVFIGPRPMLIHATADRWTTREVAVGCSIPVVQGSPPIEDPSEVERWFEELGSPVWVKDSRGWRAVPLDSPEAAARMVGLRLGTGVSKVWLEAHIPDVRHLVVSVVGDESGQTLSLGERERIVRSGDTMNMDMAPAPVSDDLRIAAGTAAVTLASTMGYVGIASVGFLADTAGGLRCLGLRPRLQVGDLLADTLHGINSVEMQVRLALGEALGWSAEHLDATGVALGLRIRARAPGLVTRWEPPAGVVMESSMAVGMPAEGLLGVMVVEAQTRQAAVVRAIAALKEMKVEGVETDIPAHLETLADVALWQGTPVRSP